MPLNEGALRVSFAGGVNTKADSKTVAAGQLLVAENVVFRRQTSLQKRYGYDGLSKSIDGSPDLLSGGIALGVRAENGSTLFGEELLQFTPNRCYSRQTGAEQWTDTGAVYSVVGTDRPLIRTGTHQVNPDFAMLNGTTVAAWEDSRGGVWWGVIDDSGRILKPATQADAAGISPRCVAVGGNLHVYYVIAASGTIMVIVVNPMAPGAAPAPTTLISDLDPASPVYDSCPTQRTGTPAAIAWMRAGGSAIRLGYVDQSGVIGTPITGHPSAVEFDAVRLPSSPLSVAYHFTDGLDGDFLAFSYVTNAGDGNVAFFSGGDTAAAPSRPITFFDDQIDEDPAYAAINVTRCALALVTVDDPGLNIAAVAAWEESSPRPSERYVAFSTFNLAGLAFTFPAPIRSVGLASRAFVVNNEAFVTLVHDTTFFNTFVVQRISGISADGIVSVGRLAPGSAGSAPTRAHLPSANLDGSIVRIALPVRERVDSPGQNVFRETGIEMFTLDFGDPHGHQTCQLGRGLYMAGACPQHYDGSIWNEMGFHFGPELVVAVPGSGGSMTSSTTYEYVVWYEWADAQGEVHRGPTSIGTVVTMGASDTQVTLTLPTYRVTNKSNVRICVARSEAAQTGDTAQKFRVTSLDPNTAGNPNGYVASSTTIDSVTFVDRMADTDVRVQEELYTDGGVLSNDPTPLGSVITRSKGRLIATDPSDGTLFRFSQPIAAGFAVEWPPDLQGTCDPFGGNITAISSQDDRVILFKESAIFVLSGDGPSESGDSSVAGFTLPQLVTSDVGCTEPSSIVLTPNGHMFQTTKGIYQLGRDGSIAYVGAPVEAFNSQRIVRAQVMPDRTQVVFVTDAGSTLLYDYLFNQWSTFTNHEGLDAVVVDNTFHYLRLDGTVYRETIGAYTDNGLKIRWRIVTAQLHMTPQLQGFQRFWYAHILGTWVSPHQLGVSYRTDYTESWSDPYWLDATGATDPTGWITGPHAQVIGLDPITGTSYGSGSYGDGPYGGIAPGVYQFRIDLNEKGESIQFQFEDFQANGVDGASFELTELLITGGIKGNAIRPFTTARSI